jgi:hypothetical protein
MNVDCFVLRRIFAFLDEIERDSIFRVCKQFRSEYLWVDPTVSLCQSLQRGDRRFANSLWSLSAEYMRITDALFVFVCSCGFDSAVADLLNDVRVDPAAFENLAVCVAAASGHLRVLEYLLSDSRVDPSMYSSFKLVGGPHHLPRIEPGSSAAALFSACQQGRADIVERLLCDPRVDPMLDDCMVLDEACVRGRLQVVDTLLRDTRVDPNLTIRHPLRVASAFGHLAVVERLLRDGRIKMIDHGGTALLHAGRNGHLVIVDRLLRERDYDPCVARSTRVIRRRAPEETIPEVVRVAQLRGHHDVVARLLQDARIAKVTNVQRSVVYSWAFGTVVLLLSLAFMYPFCRD